ncbi:MAG: DUF2442 domain-containing protein [Bacteroidales bacterium]|nr:DUF2442 domain-containing protein [Bacteroidales bacterium]MCD8393210.1 DUF2442 domain-containing protein [Bacteroidales bacterium]
MPEITFIGVIKAEHVGGYTLKILFNNGMARLYGFSKEFSKGICSKLKDIDYFLNFKLDPFSIDWNNEIGFAPEYLLENGQPVIS